MKKLTFLWKYEKYFFALFVFISLCPVLFNQYFPTIDGPAHLHNANLLKHIWFQGNTELLQFFDLNTQLNSNLINHIWFAVAGLFLPSYLVEKSILIFYIIALPYSFRYLIRNIVNAPNSNKISSYFIFPFIYTFPFCIGFFNFCIGIPILFWAVGYWLKHKETKGLKTTALLTILSTLLYFTHLFNFLLFGIILFFLLLREVYLKRKEKVELKQFIRPIIVLLPGAILFLLFLFHNNQFEHDPPRYLTKQKLVETILELGPVITLSKEREINFAYTFFYSICLGALLVLFNTIRKRKEKHSKSNLLWLGISLFVLLEYFIFPDWLSSGGFISIRWALFFFLMIIVWIGSAAISPIQLAIPVIAILIAHVFFMKYHYEETKALSADAVEATSAEAMMETNTVLLPLNYSNNWIHINYGCYQVTEKAIVVLDNYEATKPHFPLLWKKGESVYDLMKHYGDKNPPGTDVENYEKVTNHKIDYVSRWCFYGDNGDSCSIENSKMIAEKFDLIYESPKKRLQLFKRKK
ncbi:hypothetical protein BH10BAC1_BH10BAC1_00040 [soil metagenome]